VAAVAPAGGEIAAPLQGSSTSGDSAPAAAASRPSAPATTAAPPAFLIGASAPPAAGVIVIGVPTTPPSTSATGLATFSHWAPTWVSNPCSAPGIPIGKTVTVTDTDNGHVATCVVVNHGPPPTNQIIVLDASVFGRLADLVQAPIPVPLLWK
jgi:hypothetical protein